MYAIRSYYDRSYIVSLTRITSFGPVSVFIGKRELPIGKTYRKSVLEKLNYKEYLTNKNQTNEQN